MNQETTYLKLATQDDRQEVLRMCRLFYEASPFYPTVSFSPQKIEALFDLAIETGHSQVLVLLYIESSKVCGMVVGLASETPFSTDVVASELAWWVDPEYRGTRKAGDLVLAYEAWARHIGCKHVTMALLPQLTNPKVERYYDRLGYKKTEISYIKEL